MNKLILSAGVGALALFGTSCVVYEDVPVRRRTVIVREPAPPPVVVRERYIRRLPVGYRTRVYRGTSYYEHGGIYYTRHPRGYVVVRRPW